MNLDDQNKQKLYFRIKYKEDIEWCTILSPCTYQEIISAVKQGFPSLELVEFTLQDEFGANLRENFAEEYIKISPRGVLLKIREQLDTFESASTITTYSLSPRDDISLDDDNSTSSCYVDHPTEAKRVLTSNHQKYIAPEDLRNSIEKAPGGKEIFHFYNKFSTLNDEFRKRLVNLSVNYLREHFPNNCMPSSFSRQDCARALIKIFPNLKDPFSPEGYEAFYDPVTKKGFLTTRLRTVLRKKHSFSPLSKRLKLDENVEESLPATTTPEIEEAIAYMRHATPDTQTEIIKEKIVLTFDYRRKHGCDPITYPRFLDTKELISYEFSLLYPGSANAFVQAFSSYVDKILRIYTISLKNTSLVDVPTKEAPCVWNRITRAILAILHLLPPPAKGRHASNTNRETVESAQDYIIVFQKTDVPLKTILEVRKTTQPFLLAVGSNIATIDNYFMILDENILSTEHITGSKDVIAAIDVLFKTYFVFNIEYNENVKPFWMFIQGMFYNIYQGITFTSRMRELRAKLHNVNF